MSEIPRQNVVLAAGKISVCRLYPPDGIAEVKRRLIVAPSSYIVKVIDKDGMRTVKTIGGGQSAAA
eukprot:1006887-Pelagomonas_calceolata.AAC.11